MNSSCARPGTCIRQVLLIAVAIGMNCFIASLRAQVDLPSFSRPDSTSANTISVNQLLTPKKTLQSISRARQLFIDGHFEKAQKEITKALDESPNSAVALDIQGAIYLRGGQFEEAGREFQKAIDIDPTLGQAYLGLGIVLIARKRPREALVPLDRAKSLYPNSWLAYFETAIAELEIGDMDTTHQQLRKAEEFASGDAEKRSSTAYVQAQVFIKSHDFESAARYLEDTIKFDPGGCYAKPAQAKLRELKSLAEANKEALAMKKDPR